ncbi:hypothetical protein QJS10_CPA16g00717 [Acorus calamus]|uniref:Glutaredoxin domain-containing protein n=1 Tax=Acorus calamus TaxID=4465 RepID=A0AAV9D253_ACOCL|nr:hypothetical protein QJS10_CPA16g00717 [Acorus calamus]
MAMASSTSAAVATSHAFARLGIPSKEHRRITTAVFNPRRPSLRRPPHRDLSLLRLRTGSAAAPTFSFRCSSALTPELKSTLDKVVTSHKVVLFMKGTKDFPQCGFSNTVVQILKSLNVPFETLDVLENEFLRQALKDYSSWPTFPQLYIDGEFFGGCDITVEAYNNGQLQEELEKAMCS